MINAISSYGSTGAIARNEYLSQTGNAKDTADRFDKLIKELSSDESNEASITSRSTQQNENGDIAEISSVYRTPTPSHVNTMADAITAYKCGSEKEPSTPQTLTGDGVVAELHKAI